MTRTRTRYLCEACGRESLRWEGRCPECGEWNTLVEGSGSADRRSRDTTGASRAPRALGPPGATTARRTLDLGDLDLVLGGGLVPGCLVLLGGPPGIGKSTLMLQIAAGVAAAGGTALYASGEESAEQVRLRAARLGRGARDVLFLAETEVEAVRAAAQTVGPDLLCVDSVQTLRSRGLESSPGTVNQVRECAGSLQEWAKRRGVATFLVGHVTKGGALAGPRTLEHLVDVVVQFEGPKATATRILRATKNRYGRAGEVAVFRMGSRGLKPVADASRVFLAGRRADVSGSALTVALEGTRPFLVEVQALTAESRFPSSQRLSTGYPSRRLAMLLAVLERRGGLSVGRSDVFINVVGGLRLADPAADLAVLGALISAELDRPLPKGWALFGEVGLGGEIRGVAGEPERLREAARGGLTTVLLAAAEERAEGDEAGSARSAGMPLRRVKHVRELVRSLRDRPPDAA